MKADTLTKVASSNIKSLWQDLIGFIGVLRYGEYDIVIMYIPRRSYIGIIPKSVTKQCNVKER